MGVQMKNETENLVEEINDNTDILIEYLKMILERLDAIMESMISRDCRESI